MPYQITTATRKVSRLNKRIRAVQGGTSASKTISILLWLINLSQADKKPTITSVVSESLPHLKKGAIRDFKSIMQEHGYWDDNRWNQTDFIYTFETKSIIEFFSVDQSDKTRGPRRDRLFINEANNVSLDAFEQLEVRTRDFVFLDWNPSNEFWFYTEVLKKRDDVEHIILTYRDNEALDESIVRSIEQRKNRPGWWKVFGEGQLGEVEGKIYTDWEIIDEVPHQARLERYGLNFGFTGHPAAIVAVYYIDGGYILDEIAYGQGFVNRVLADYITSQPRKALVVADSAEPKSIAELKEYGVDIVPAEKGKDSVRHGINVVQDQRISVTKRSVNIIREYRNYLWKYDKDGKNTNEPEEPFHYSMDAVRYGICSLAPIKRREEFIRSIPRLVSNKKRVNPAL